MKAVRDEEEEDKGLRFRNVSWHTLSEPSTARYRISGKDRSERPVDLSKEILDGPVLLYLGSRWGTRRHRVPVITGRTIGDVLWAIHDFYQRYITTRIMRDEKLEAYEEDQDTYRIGGLVWFEGMAKVSSEAWDVHLGT